MAAQMWEERALAAPTAPQVPQRGILPKVQTLQKKHLAQIEIIWTISKTLMDRISEGTITRCFYYIDKDYGKAVVLQAPDGSLRQIYTANHTTMLKHILLEGLPQYFI